jgi:hypothetical protein
MINSAESAVEALEQRERLLRLREMEASGEKGDATPTQGNVSAAFDPSLGRRRGIKYTRWDTTTSSEFSDWR